MYDDQDSDASIINDPLSPKKHNTVAAGPCKGIYTPPPSTQRSVNPTTQQYEQYRCVTPTPMAERETRISEATLAPRPFSGSSKDNAERWLRYFTEYTRYKNMRDDDIVQLFKLLLTDHASDWLYTLPQEVQRSWEALGHAFESRWLPSELQRYNTASNMWTRVQQPDESVETFITAVQTAANQIHFKDDQQLGYCIIRGLRPAIRTYVLQNDHTTIDNIIRHAKVAEIANAGTAETDKTVADLSRTVTLLAEQLSTRDTKSPAPVRSAVANVDQQHNTRRRPQSTASYRQFDNRRQTSTNWTRQVPRPSTPQQQRQLRRPGYQQPQRVDRTNDGNNAWTPQCGNCLTLHSRGQCPAYGLVCFFCNRKNHIARACRSRARPQVRFSTQ